MPALAVVMPVRNAAPYLNASIQSILTQTFTDFEFVALDDASTDNSWEILSSWAARDSRLRVVRVSSPLGLAGSSNAVVRETAAPLIARMDADDVSHPERLARQLDVLQRDSRIVLVGTLFEGIDAGGRVVRPRDRWRLVRPTPFAPFPHGSTAFRRDAFERVGGYSPDAEFWEDLHLFRRLSRQGRVVVLPQALYRYRFHEASARFVNDRAVVERAVERMLQAVAADTGRAPTRAGGDSVAPRCSPSAAYLLAAPLLWAGHPPRLLSRLNIRMLLTLNPTTLAIAAVAAFSAASPRMTRTLLAWVIAARDRLAGLRVGTKPFEWHFA